MPFQQGKLIQKKEDKHVGLPQDFSTSSAPVKAPTPPDVRVSASGGGTKHLSAA